MTHDEAVLLKTYLDLDAGAFEEWYRGIRDGTAAGELEDKSELNAARAWERGSPGRREGLRRVDRGARGLGAGRRRGAAMSTDRGIASFAPCPETPMPTKVGGAKLVGPSPRRRRR